MEISYQFIDKKEKLANLLEEYLENQEKEKELINYIDELKTDEEFKEKELFKNIFVELTKYLPELSRKELKQRILMIKGFIE